MKFKKVMDNRRYKVWDLFLGDFTISITELKPKQETRGHKHPAKELYFFLDGGLKLETDSFRVPITEKDYCVFKSNKFHKVINPSAKTKRFLTIKRGKRK